MCRRCTREWDQQRPRLISDHHKFDRPPAQDSRTGVRTRAVRSVTPSLGQVEEIEAKVALVASSLGDQPWDIDQFQTWIYANFTETVQTLGEGN